MHTWKLLGVLMVVLPYDGISQLIRTEYYDVMWKLADQNRYDVKRDIFLTDTGYVYMDYWKNDRLKFKGSYTSINPDVPHGHFEFYYKNGRLEGEGDYMKGSLSGKWNLYSEKGELRKMIDYDIKEVLCLETDSMHLHSINDAIDTSQVESIPRFQGGNPDLFYAYLYQTIEFPLLPRMYFKTGKSIGIFTIDAEGNVCNVSAEGDIDPDLKKETVRVISLLPKWEPGKTGNRPVTVKFTCPIMFKFQ